ncbi:MAG: hypothetical protein AB1813_00980 [Verrucomicrobiota bacterium]|jgi:hypothetical protein
MILSLLVLVAVLVFFLGNRTESVLPDGSVLKVLGVTTGTNHVVYSKPWDRVIRMMPFLPRRIYSAAEPFGWKSKSPSLVVWCSWRDFGPTSPQPEFVLVDRQGRESGVLEKGGALTPTNPASRATIIRGQFAVGQFVPDDRYIRVRVYQVDQHQSRICAGDWNF